MQDLEWNGHCTISGAFVTLLGIGCCCILLLALMFAIDETDFERAAFTLRDFIHHLATGI